MHSKRTLLLALAVLVLVVPFGTAAAYSPQYASGHPPKSGSQAVNLSLAGGVLDAGRQTYELGGGQVVAAFYNGNPITDANLQYSMFSIVDRMNTWGFSHLQLSGMSAEGQVNIDAWTIINNSVPAALLPLGCSQGINCTSEIPAMFVGGSIITASVGGTTKTLELPMSIESAYLNPFGGPIVITSLENLTNPAIVIVANYTVANINWYGVQMAGMVGGTFGSSIGHGAFAMNVNSRENLVTGIEHDSGTIVLMGVGPHGKNIEGTFRGTSIVPPGTSPAAKAATQALCPSTLLYFGACTMTGLNSTGTMSLRSGNYQITGSYVTGWGIPAIGFNSTVSATATHAHHNNHHQQTEYSDN